MARTKRTILKPAILNLSDKSMLDCPICLLPLTIPVLQCTNGHIICSSCLLRLKKIKCPVCSSKNPGSIRNRAIEQVLESVTDYCANKPSGCSVGELAYSTKRAHEQDCAYSPYTCPCSKTCCFLGSPAELRLHLQTAHKNITVAFRTNQSLEVSSDVDYVHLLDDDNKGAIFILDTWKMNVTSISLDLEVEPPVFCYSLASRREYAFFEFLPETVQCRCAADAVWNLPPVDKRVFEPGNRMSLASLVDENGYINLQVVLDSSNLKTMKI